MVCWRMGLLDDAIREHLELKRLRGADPGLVAREEHEAFGPVRGGEPASRGDDVGDAEDLAEDLADGGAQPGEDDHAQTLAGDDAQGFSNVGQETVELDMRTVLDEEPGRDAVPVGPDVGGPVGGGPTEDDPHSKQDAADDSLEWEMPGGGASQDDPGRADEDRDAHGNDAHADGSGGRSDGAAEDVLEETPDFLRDTPEQERLWFEQRPPRDFDFDK
jgi:hypothetical protein